VVQETRLYDPERDETRSMRSKEDAHDYRYFPDPDLLPIVVGAAQIARVRQTLPELPWARRARYVADYALPAADADALTQDRAVADYFEALVAASDDARAASNWLNGEVFAALNRAGTGIEACPVTPAALGRLISRVRDGTVSGSMAKQVFEAMWSGEGDADDIIEARGLRQVNDAGALAAIIDEVVAASPQQVEQYRAGKDKVFGFFVGQVMKKSQGKANPQQVNDLLKEKLSGN